MIKAIHGINNTQSGWEGDSVVKDNPGDMAASFLRNVMLKNKPDMRQDESRLVLFNFGCLLNFEVADLSKCPKNSLQRLDKNHD
jgi:hypothetical protein